MDTPASLALHAYRHLLRATRTAFRNDHHLLHAARLQARKGFDHAAGLTAATPEAEKAVAHAEEVAKILVQNIVQGEKIGTEDGKDMYRLNIHDGTERGHNDTIKNPLTGGTVGVFKKCS